MGVSRKARSILIIFAILALTILAISFANMHSLVLGIVVLVLASAVLVSLGHNCEQYGPSRREENDAFMFEACDSGFFSRARRFYRHLPASPRCRVCLLPFGRYWPRSSDLALTKEPELLHQLHRQLS